MKKNLLLSIITVVLLSACNIPGAVTPFPLAVSEELVIENTPTPGPSGISVSFQNVNLIIPEGLASGATTELIPTVDDVDGGPWGVAPEHIVFTLTNYSPLVGSLDAVVQIYPAQEYAAVNPWAESSLTRLQAILADPSIPFTNDNLSTVPFNGAAEQHYAAQAKLINFNDGKGVRMISQYGQFPGKIINSNSFYHYEGLTNDGKYMVAALLPLSIPLQSTAENPDADGIPYPSDISDRAGISAYYQGVTDKLNAASSESFQPSLSQLDALIQSITINGE